MSFSGVWSKDLKSIAESYSILGEKAGLNLLHPAMDLAPFDINTYLSSPEAAGFSRLQYRRLGYYVEHLVGMLCDMDIRTQVLLRNAVIESSGRTLGEIDLLVCRLIMDQDPSCLRESSPMWQLQHWEITCKFLLYNGTNPNKYSSYVGINFTDRLDKKIDLLKNKQLKSLDSLWSAKIINQALELANKRNLTLVDHSVVSLAMFLGRIYLPYQNQFISTFQQIIDLKNSLRNDLDTFGFLRKEFSAGLWFSLDSIGILRSWNLNFAILSNLDMFNKDGPSDLCFDTFLSRVTKNLVDLGANGLFFRAVDRCGCILEGAVVHDKWLANQN